MIQVASISHETASLDEREPYSYTDTQARTRIREWYQLEGVDGVVLITTCNRTELYISTRGAVSSRSLLGADEEICTELMEEEAVQHLMEVACGLRSRVLGEDQIVSQVRTSIERAREEQTVDGELETLFRLAVTAAKKAKTQVPLRAVPMSSASVAVQKTKELMGDLKGVSAMVIGNGEIGRLCVEELVKAGASVWMTLRTHKHQTLIVPEGCETIPYEERYQWLTKMQLVISATASPHYTLTCRQLDMESSLVIVDLASPRDVESGIRERSGITYFDIDDIGMGLSKEQQELILRIRQIIEEYKNRFVHWRAYRKERS